MAPISIRGSELYNVGVVFLEKFPVMIKRWHFSFAYRFDLHIADQICAEASVNDVSSTKAIMLESTFGAEPFSQATVDGFLYQTISIDLSMHCDTSKKLPIHSNAWNAMPTSCEDVHAFSCCFYPRTWTWIRRSAVSLRPHDASFMKIQKLCHMVRVACN